MTIAPNARLEHAGGNVRVNVVEPLPSGHVRFQFFYERDGEPTIKDSVWVDGPAEKVTEKRLLAAIDHKVIERQARDSRAPGQWEVPEHLKPNARTAAPPKPARPVRQPWAGAGGLTSSTESA